jgi:hypothetical protein
MKYTVELLVILLLSIGFAVLLPGFMLGSKTIVFHSLSELIITSTGAFVLLSLAYFAFKKIRN